jgi:hypothetical protein
VIVSFYSHYQSNQKGTHTMNTRTASFAAYFSGVFAILSGVFAILFFWLEAPYLSSSAGQQTHIWGPLSDICPIVQMLALLIVVQALYRLDRSGAALNRLTYLIGIVGTLGVSILQLLLVIGVISFEQEIGPMLSATAIVGVWLVLASHLGRRQAQLPARLVWLGIGVGAALALELPLFAVMGGAVDWQNIMSNPLLMVGAALVFVMSYVGFPIWAFWLGHTLVNHQPEFSGQPGTAITQAR